MENIKSLEDFSYINEEEKKVSLTSKLSEINDKKDEVKLKIDELELKLKDKVGDEQQLLELQLVLKKRQLEDLDTKIKIERLKDRISRSKD